MIHRISIDQLMKLTDPIPVLDVRTPAEFTHGHIPGAFNLPLFSNEERVVVGTTYKQQSREAAILLGFDLAGPKWSGFIRQALEMVPGKKLAVHCWRGGMRSGAMAWALDLYGFDVYLLDGGYKRYRNWVHKKFEQEYLLYVVGGKTGSGKTQLLRHLTTLNEQVIDLEDLAQHQGSSYGTLNRLVQPSQEQFENDLAHQLNKLDPHQRIWVEDESGNIGHRMIPRHFWNQLRKGYLFDLQVSLQQRVTSLVKEYGSLDKDFLIECTQRICKRLGTEQTKNAILAIREHRMEDFIRLALVYYDKTYRNGLIGRDPEYIFILPAKGSDPSGDARMLLDFINTLIPPASRAHTPTP